jgi:hypothetical protein
MSDPSLSPEPPADHSVKIPQLIFGLLFLGIAGVWALVASEVVTEDRLPVIIPALLIGAGVIGLAASLASGRNRRQRQQDHQQDHHHHQDRAADASVPDEHTEEIR